MLRKTFSHVPGLGAATERSLWQQGCLDWADYLTAPDDWDVAGADRGLLSHVLQASEAALAERHHQFFRDVLGARNAWRAWPEFRDCCLYLDIETDGGSDGDSVTCCGVFDGDEFRCYVKDDDLGSLPDVLSRHGMLVTFFGTGFDVPMLRRAFPFEPFDHIHFDLCPALRRVGVRGGLKKIERELGIARGEDTDGLDGRDAIRLWRQFRLGSDAALETLVAYNREDVVNLEHLAAIAYERLVAAEMA